MLAQFIQDDLWIVPTVVLIGLLTSAVMAFIRGTAALNLDQDEDA